MLPKWDSSEVIEWGGNSWFSSANVNAIYDIPNDTIDVVALGPSTTMRSFSPLELYGNYGLSAINLGTGNQPPMGGYYMLIELLKTQTPKVVFLEAFTLVHPNSAESFFRVTFDFLRMSQGKFEGVVEHSKSDGADSLISYIFPLLKYHTTWKSIYPELLLKFKPEEHSTYHYGYHLDNHQMQPVEFDGWEEKTVTGVSAYNIDAYEYLSKTIELCKANNIEVILYKSPHQGWAERDFAAVETFAKLYEVPYYDFNTAAIIESSGVSFETDFGDPSHLNLIGALKVTNYLGEVLEKHYQLPDRRNDAKYEHINKGYIRYVREKENAGFGLTKNMLSYLDLIESSKDDYTIFFSIMDEATYSLDIQLLTALTQIGFETEFTNKFGFPFIGVISNGEVIYEQIGMKQDDELSYSGKLLDNKSFEVKSVGIPERYSSIIVDDVEYAKNVRGFNIVVYDNKYNHVVDSIAFDTWIDAGVTYVR
jgi:hypothetical protein